MDKYLQIIASASLFRGIAKTEIAAVLQNLDAQLRVYPRNSFIWQLGEQVTTDRKSTRLNSSHYQQSRMPSSA